MYPSERLFLFLRASEFRLPQSNGAIPLFSLRAEAPSCSRWRFRFDEWLRTAPISHQKEPGQNTTNATGDWIETLPVRS